MVTSPDKMKYRITDAWHRKLFDHDVVPGVDDPWEHMGLVTKRLDKKPAFDSYKTIIRKVDYFTGIKKLDQGQYVYTFFVTEIRFMYYGVTPGVLLCLPA